MLAPSKPAGTTALRPVPAEPGWRVQPVPAEHYRSEPRLCFTPVMQPDLDHEFHDWRSYANCAGADNPDQFNPTNGGYRVNETIRKYCDPCPVKAQCEALAVRNGDEGVYGGTTATDRRRRGLRLREASRARGAAARDAAAVDMVNAGHPATEVAEALGVSHRTVLRATARARKAARAA